MKAEPRYLTLMVVPDATSAHVRRVRVRHAWLKAAGALLGALLLLAVGASGLAAWTWGQVGQGAELKRENARMRTALVALEQRVADASAKVEQLSQAEMKLRRLTLVSDPDRNLAVGPVGGADPHPSTEGLPTASFAAHTDGGAGSIARRAEVLGEGSTKALASMRELSELLDRESARLARTPSRRPTRGYTSSGFGVRTDPFTGLSQRHAGLDFSAEVGTEVRATADGTVRFAATHGAYGQLVEIDHGFGLTTRYAHLSQIDVKAGQKVGRGSPIGRVGNTGRSTGPHLHYEVRLLGVPRDPRAFILD